jgi:2-oxoglutarate ferredoxin oxidoreductase subunit gamma
MIIAGFGGQGVMTIGKFAATVGMREGREVIYLPAYGAEVRGGTANCYVIISDQPIYSPVVEIADTLFIMNQPSYDKFRSRLKEGGLLLVNSSMAQIDEELERRRKARLVRVHATHCANELGNVRTANVVMLGAYCAAGGALSSATVLNEMESELAGDKPHLLEVNRAAFRKGLEIGRRELKTENK